MQVRDGCGTKVDNVSLDSATIWVLTTGSKMVSVNKISGSMPGVCATMSAPMDVRFKVHELLVVQRITSVMTIRSIYAFQRITQHGGIEQTANMHQEMKLQQVD